MPKKDGEITEIISRSAGGFDAATISAHVDEAAKAPPPVHLWNPPFCGDLDMRIARDGTWYYLGTPIGRKRLVKLFSSVLRHDQDGKFYLVTPVEKIGITVDDAPFVAVEMQAEGAGEGQTLRFRNNVEDWVTADGEHPLRMEINPETGEPAPYVLMRGRLEALISRAVYYDLVALGVERQLGDDYVFGVWSGGTFFPLGQLSEDG